MSRESLRVLQVYKDFYPPVFGGIERHLHDLVSGLPALGVHCDVLVAARNAHTREETFPPAAPGALPVRVVKVGELGRVLSAPMAPGFVPWLRRLAPHYDILHFHFPNPTAELAWLLAAARAPAVVTYHSDIVRQRISAMLYRPVLRRYLARMQRIIVPSPQLLNSSPVLAAQRHKCAVVPFGIDAARFESPDLPRAAAELRARCTGGDSGALLVLFVGKFRYYKGLPVLLHAIARLRARGVAARGLLVGDGPEEATLRAQVRQLGLSDQVSFLGGKNDEELNVLYHACDVLVLPSVQRSEAFGLVLLEAMACGKPVISTELGTATSWVNLHEVTGLVVAPGDAAALARALEHLASAPVMRRNLGENARRRVQTMFQQKQMLKEILRQYRSLGAHTESAASSNFAEAVPGH